LFGRGDSGEVCIDVSGDQGKMMKRELFVSGRERLLRFSSAKETLLEAGNLDCHESSGYLTHYVIAMTDQLLYHHNNVYSRVSCSVPRQSIRVL
jgi:hypothetical protein